MELPQTFDNGITVLKVVGAPRWDDQGNTRIGMLVEFAHLPGGAVDFCASPDDSEPHGRELFEAAKAGEFGNLMPFALTVDAARQQVSLLVISATAKIDGLQLEVNTLQDAVDLEMATEAEAARLAAAKTELTAWKRYRVLLSRVEAQAGFPDAIEWPEKPA